MMARTLFRVENGIEKDPRLPRLTDTSVRPEEP
jgi:hypothetical protein